MTETERTTDRTPLAEQIAEVEREIRQRARCYPKWVEQGRYLQATADRKLAALRDVQSTLIWLEANLGWIRPEAERRRELRDVCTEPAVAAVLAEFPDARITIIPRVGIQSAANEEGHSR